MKWVLTEWQSVSDTDKTLLLAMMQEPSDNQAEYCRETLLWNNKNTWYALLSAKFFNIPVWPTWLNEM